MQTSASVAMLRAPGHSHCPAGPIRAKFRPNEQECGRPTAAKRGSEQNARFREERFLSAIRRARHERDRVGQEIVRMLARPFRGVAASAAADMAIAFLPLFAFPYGTIEPLASQGRAMGIGEARARMGILRLRSPHLDALRWIVAEGAGGRGPRSTPDISTSAGSITAFRIRCSFQPPVCRRPPHRSSADPRRRPSGRERRTG